MPILKIPVRLFCGLFLLTALLACTSTGGPLTSDLPLSDEPLVGKFVWHDLITDDVDRARRFYAGLFEWEFEDSTRMGGEPYVLIKSGGYYIGGMVQLADPEDGEYTRWLGYLSVSNVDAAAAATREEGGAVVVAPLDLGEVARVAAITDPQGAVVGLIRSHVGDPADDFQTKPGHVVWNELLASDDQAAAKFYSRLAAFEVNAQARSGGEYLVLEKNSVSRAGVMQRPNDDIEPLWLTHFAVSDPAASAARAASLGGQVLLSPDPEIRAGSMALVTDPGGAVLALRRWSKGGL